MEVSKNQAPHHARPIMQIKTHIESLINESEYLLNGVKKEDFDFQEFKKDFKEHLRYEFISNARPDSNGKIKDIVIREISDEYFHIPRRTTDILMFIPIAIDYVKRILSGNWRF